MKRRVDGRAPITDDIGWRRLKKGAVVVDGADAAWRLV